MYPVSKSLLNSVLGLGGAAYLILGAAVSAIAEPAPQVTQPADTQQALLERQPSSPSPLLGYPLAEPGLQITEYGWQVDLTSEKALFHGGVDLRAYVGAPVLGVGKGIVAFAGEQKGYGNVVVLNHAQGLQTRYAHLDSINVQPGEAVEGHALLGHVGQSGSPSWPTPHLHFEVRLNSPVGWVAQDPNTYFQSTALVGQGMGNQADGNQVVGRQLTSIGQAVAALAPN